MYLKQKKTNKTKIHLIYSIGELRNLQVPPSKVTAPTFNIRNSLQSQIHQPCLALSV